MFMVRRTDLVDANKAAHASDATGTRALISAFHQKDRNP